MEEQTTQIVDLLKKRQLVFFVGAGISMAPPSNLPAAGNLRDMVTQAVCERSKVTRGCYDRIRSKNLPLEVVFQMIYDRIGDHFFDCLDVLDDGKPNDNHRFLAKAAKDGHVKAIITTNFDHLIEDAMTDPEIGLEHGRDFRVYADERSFIPREDVIEIFKIHGTIDDRSTIITTLQQVGKGLSLNKAETLEYFLRNYFIIFVGYGGNDLDIYPKILSTESKGIFWVFRPGDRNEEVEKLLTESNRKIERDLNQLFWDLWREMDFSIQRKKSKHISSDAITIDFYGQMNTWGNEIKENTAISTIGQILEHIGDWNDALNCHQASLCFSEESSDPAGVVDSLVDLGLVYTDKREWRKAVQCYTRGLEMLKGGGNTRLVGKICGNIGAVFARKGKWDKSIKFYKRSVRLLNEKEDTQAVAQTYNNVGLVHVEKWNLNEAVRCYKESLELYGRIGDVHGIAQTNTNLGAVCYRMGDWDEAMHYYNEALKILDKLGDVHSVADCCENLGLIYTEKGEFPKALEYYSKSREIYAKIGDNQGIGRNNCNIGLIYAEQGELDVAIWHYEMSLNILEKMGDTQGLATALNNLGLAYTGKGNLDESMSYHKKALKIYQKLGAIHGIAQTTNNIGTVHYRRHNWRRAKMCYQRALKVFQKIGDKHALARTHFNLSLIYESLNNLRKALSYIQRAMVLFGQLGLKTRYEDARRAMLRMKRKTRKESGHK